MNIALAKQSDINRLAYIIEATFHLACPKNSNRDLQSRYMAKHLSAEKFEQLLNADNANIWVAFDKKIAVGLAVLEIKSDKLVMLSKLYVLPEYQGKGAAFKLYSAVVNYAKKAKYKNLNLSVYSENLKAKAFYEKQGFKLIGDCDFAMETEIHKDHIYQRSLE